MNKKKIGRLMGILLQGVALGILLSLALIKIFTLSSGARIFRYEGY